MAVEFLTAELGAVGRVQYVGDHLKQLYPDKWLLNKGPAVIEDQEISIRSPRHQHHVYARKSIEQLPAIRKIQKHAGDPRA